MVGTRDADAIFKNFKEYSIAEFFKKNRQMLGYAGKVRSLTTIVHEYVTNSLDACEEAGILPEISVEIKEISEERYSIKVQDNGPGIPSKLVGKALATILAGTKFNRYMQQRGQQGIGAASCTLYSLITTNKPVHVRSGTARESYECDISVDVKSNKPIITNLVSLDKSIKGVAVSGEFGELKYESSDHGVSEYLKRTALSNPHVTVRLVEPSGNELLFPRHTNTLTQRPKQIKPHPLGLSTNDLIDFAQYSSSNKLSSFLVDTFSRLTYNKIDELKQLAPKIDFNSDPKKLTWADAEELIKAFKKIKWIAPEMDALSIIGEEQLKIATKNILNPEFSEVIERKPRVFRGGVPFVVETAIAYGGGAGKQGKDFVGGNILRFANKVPLLFDSTNCAITEAVKSVQWKRYNISNFDEEPISVMVNVSSVYVPYSGVGKQAVSQEEEIIEEIKLAVMDAARSLQKYMSHVRNRGIQESKYKTITRYISQLSGDLSELTGTKREKIEASLHSIIKNKYKSVFEKNENDQGHIDENKKEKSDEKDEESED